MLQRRVSSDTWNIFSASFQVIRSEAQADELFAALDTEQLGRLAVVATMQAALDAGEKVPESATAHDVATTYSATSRLCFAPSSLSPSLLCAPFTNTVHGCNAYVA